MAEIDEAQKNIEQTKQGNTATDTDKSSGVRLPSISVPKGGGAIRGIGENFCNPSTGTASLNVPIYTSPGRSAFGRNFHFHTILALVMDHSALVGVPRCHQ